MSEKCDTRACVREIVREELAKQPQGKTKRAKRAASSYNLHMKKCLKGLKGRGDHRENFSYCVTQWKKKKK